MEVATVEAVVEQTHLVDQVVAGRKGKAAGVVVNGFGFGMSGFVAGSHSSSTQ